MMKNPLTNIFNRTKTGRSTGKAFAIVRTTTKPNNVLTRTFKALGKRRVGDRFGDNPT